MYLMTCTRPDLAYPFSLLARYMAPGRHRKVHWDAAKRVLRYLCRTSDMGLVLGGRGPIVLTGHADACWGDDLDTQRSSQAYTFSLGSSSVLRRSTCSSSVLSPSCEVEIYAGAMAAKELRWLTYLLTDLGEQPRSPPYLYQRGQIHLAYVATRASTANIFTKALSPSYHQRFSLVLGLFALPFLTGLQLREWYAGRGRSGGAGPCAYVLRTGTRSGEVCGLPHTTQRCFGRLTDAWRTHFPDAVDLPHWHDLLLQNVPIFDLDFDAILAAMYALADITEGDCYLRVPPDPSTVAVALGASVSAAPGANAAAALGASTSAAPSAGTSPLSGTAPTESLHSFTLDSGASRSFFRDSTTLTPLHQPIAVSLADPSGGPILAHSSTVLPCPAAPSGLLSGLHLPSFSTNLVSRADLQDAWVDQFTPGGQRVTHCTSSQTTYYLATFTRRPGSSLYTLTTAPPPVSTSGQVAASTQVFAAASKSSPASAPYSCRPLAHETLLWHHRLGHPSLPCLRGMASRALVSGLPRSLPPLPLGPAPTCVPCVEGRQRATPHSSSYPPTEAPLQTLHMDVLGPAPVRGQGHERYFLLIVDNYSRYTTVFPLRSKGEVPGVLIDWIRGTRRQLSEKFGSDLPVLRLHSDRGGEFSSDLLRAFCRLEGIRHTFTLPASLHQNGIAERRIGMVMDVARTSMIHAAAPHFLWPFAVQYAAHQINLQPRVSLPETTPTLRWTGKVGDASAFRVWGSRAFVRDTTADKLSSRAVPCVFLGFPPDARVAVLPPHLTSYPAEPVEVAVDSGAARGTEPGGAESEGAEPGGAETGRAGPASVCPPSVGGECALGTDVLEDRQEDLECFAAASPHLVSMLLAPEGDPDALDIPTPRSYAEAIEDKVPPPGANIVSGMWIFRVKRPPGSPPAFKARYVARGFSQRQGVDFFQTFSPTPKMTTLRVLLHFAAQRYYELHSLDFSTAFLQGSLHEEIWLRCPPGFTGSFPAGTQWSLRRPVYGLRQAPREWHDTLRTTLAALGFAPSTADPSLFLRTDTTLPPFYVLVHLHRLRHPRRRHRHHCLHCCCRHLHHHHHPHYHPHSPHCLHHHRHRPCRPNERPCPPCLCQCGGPH
ncbi:unnamed protein product [Closterium sp. NIES-53]